jgi:hypothetical protein
MFILGDNYETVDMSQIVPGGSKDATVEGSILQELDKNKNVIFQWRSWDHYQITDATHENLTALNIDYVHANAIEIDTDGNILLSARHLDEITKINSQTGDIIWRWGGKNNQFTFVNDSIAFSHQHAIRILPNDDKIFFDNGNFHTPPFSRAVEYNLDEVKKTAVLVWQFRNNPDIFGSALGYVQRLANGNTLISWGQADTTLSEVTPEGTVALQMTLPVSDWTYRVYRLPFIFIQSPSTNENLQSDAPTTIRWESSGVDSVNIDFSIDGGKTWNNIINNYPGDVDSLIWSVPNISSSNCKIRITESGVMDLGNVFISDSEFNISNLLDVKGNAVPYTYQLFNNYPNPFNPSTVISYSLAADSKVTIKIYNLLGQLIKELLNATQNTGNQQVVFNASNLSSGVYFYSMSAVSIDGKEEYSSIKKMVLLK